MKTYSIPIFVAASALLANVCFADETLPKIPTDEKAFVDAISKLDKAKIVAQFGQPASADDVKLKDSGKIVASIWHYHNINQAADGNLYQTTELDFIEDKVVQVVFLNNDGSDANDSKTYELPQPSPDETPQGYTPMNPPIENPPPGM